MSNFKFKMKTPYYYLLKNKSHETHHIMLIFRLHHAHADSSGRGAKRNFPTK